MRNLFFIFALTLLAAQASFAISPTDPEVRTARSGRSSGGGGGFVEDSGNSNSGYSSSIGGNDNRAGAGASYYDPNCPVGMTGSRSSNRGNPYRLGSNLREIAQASEGSSFWGGGTSVDPAVLRAIEIMKSRQLGYAAGKCTAYVREGLQRAGVLPPGRFGVAASSYAQVLKGFCFQNRISQYPTPESAPAGAILVYRGIDLRGDKNAKYGHIEAKTSEGGYVSDYYSQTARTGGGASGRNRQLIGVMIKPAGAGSRCR